MKCWGCDGDGTIVCPPCNGRGKVENDDDDVPTGQGFDLIECGGCRGNGRMECRKCAGRGELPPYKKD
jgi:DnaJ-class molecular chaperone